MDEDWGVDSVPGFLFWANKTEAKTRRSEVKVIRFIKIHFETKYTQSFHFLVQINDEWQYFLCYLKMNWVGVIPVGNDVFFLPSEP